MNSYLVIILTILIAEYVLTLAVEILNMRHVTSALPAEFQGFYDAKKYENSQNYLKAQTKFALVKTSFFTYVTIVSILCGVFNIIDLFARSFHAHYLATALIFGAVILLYLKLLDVPFSMYHTFVLEAKYGFNKTTLKTFVSDALKSLALTGLIGGIVFAIVVWFFTVTGRSAWLYCWAAVTLFELFLVFVAPVVILPLFNKFVPLAPGELKRAIEDFAQQQHFVLKGIFTMDGSKRSTKSNAFFTGFGRFKRIALFDTLIARHTKEELVSILAHEIGHFKHKHVAKGLALSVVTAGIMFFILSFFINNLGLFEAFSMKYFSVYASIVFFGFLFTPINFILNILSNMISRAHEYEADAFAVSTYKQPQAFIDALKKLSVDSLSNLTPHPLKVFLDYSHPPVIERVRAIKEIIKKKR